MKSYTEFYNLKYIFNLKTYSKLYNFKIFLNCVI